MGACRATVGTTPALSPCLNAVLQVVECETACPCPPEAGVPGGASACCAWEGLVLAKTMKPGGPDEWWATAEWDALRGWVRNELLQEGEGEELLAELEELEGWATKKPDGCSLDVSMERARWGAAANWDALVSTVPLAPTRAAPPQPLHTDIRLHVNERAAAFGADAADRCAELEPGSRVFFAGQVVIATATRVVVETTTVGSRTRHVRDAQRSAQACGADEWWSGSEWDALRLWAREELRAEGHGDGSELLAQLTELESWAQQAAPVCQPNP